MRFEDLNPHNLPITYEIEANMRILLAKTRLLLETIPEEILHSNTFSVTSGLRSQAQQQKLIDNGRTKAKMSMHLFGAAVDLYDPRGDLDNWCFDKIGRAHV